MCNLTSNDAVGLVRVDNIHGTVTQQHNPRRDASIHCSKISSEPLQQFSNMLGAFQAWVLKDKLARHQHCILSLERYLSLGRAVGEIVLSGYSGEMHIAIVIREPEWGIGTVMCTQRILWRLRSRH